ncbi:MAG: LysR family transcriptional regulator [Candidatus Dormibacteria bacterium]
MDRINIGWLKNFVEVARLEHLGRAAEVLQTDQSTVSRKIARLEEEVGVELFERIGRSVRLTQAGTRFLSRAERLLHDAREAVSDAQGAVSSESGEVQIGFLHTVGARWLPERMASFLAAHPGIRFVLEEGTTAHVARSVLSGDLDLGILGPPPTNMPELAITPLFEEIVAVVVPNGHRLAGARLCALRDIAGEPLILPKSRSGLRKIIDDAFARAGLAVDVAYEGNDFTIVQGLVEAGLGTSLLPLPLPFPSDLVACVPLDGPAIARTVALCWDRRRTLPPAAALFVDQLTEEAPSRLGA